MAKEAIKNIKIDNGVCFSCGEEFESVGPLKKTMHHCLPSLINPKFNVLIPLHKVCHEELNKLYVHSVPKQPKAIGLPSFKRVQNDIQGIIGHSETFTKKIKKVLDKVDKVVADREPKKETTNDNK